MSAGRNGGGVHYAFHFKRSMGPLQRDLAEGAWPTHSAFGAAMMIGLAVATACAYAKTAGPSPAPPGVTAYIECDQEHSVPGSDLHHLLLLAGAGHLGGSKRSCDYAVVRPISARLWNEILRAGNRIHSSAGRLTPRRPSALSRLQNIPLCGAIPGAENRYFQPWPANSFC